MGGDVGPHLAFEAACQYLKLYPTDRLVLVGQLSSLQPAWLEREKLAPELTGRLRLLNADDVVNSNDKPAFALRNRKASSMWLSLQLLAQNEVDACVSGGNTGALMAMGRHLLHCLDGIKRPAICKSVPSSTGSAYLVDLGANIDCSAYQLLEFARMGVAMARVNGVSDPKVGLLNIGVEASKGGQVVKDAAALMARQSGINFVGFVEGDGLFGGQVDVLVCDGFVGNVAVKVSEGLVKYITSGFHETMNASVFTRLIGVLTRPLLKPWISRLNPSLHNGAVMLGLQHVVVKSHGGADLTGMINALDTARNLVVGRLPSKIQHELSVLLN